MDERADSSEFIFNGDSFNMYQADFMQDPEIENLISIIRGETADPIEKFCLDNACNHFTNCCTDLQLQPPQPLSYGLNEIFDTGYGTHISDAINPNSNVILNQESEGIKVFEGFGDGNSSETVRQSEGGTKVDRKKTLISERKRRNGMKEKLYALRALVPDITKMDKASIIGDAARYIQDLQTQARNLKAEIAAIEASKSQKMSSPNSKTIHLSNPFPIMKKISKMDMFHIEEKGYYVRLVCKKGPGVAVSLHKALESLTSFQVQSSNVAAVDDNFVLTFTLNVEVYEFDIDIPNLKLWVAGAFINQGFEFTIFPSA